MDDRIAAIDVTRGVAVMGILAMNITGFAWPETAYVAPTAGGGTSLPDLFVWAAGFVLVDGKMRGLFSMLFGASLLIITDRAAAAGQNPARVHGARMVVLALIGLAHFYLLWWGDILLLYAITGGIAFRFRALPAYWLWRCGAAFIGVSTLSFASSLVAARLFAGQGGDAARGYASLIGQYAPRSAVNLHDMLVYRSGYATILHHRLVDRAIDPLVDALRFVPETLGLMLIGMALYRSGLFVGGWDRGRLARWRNAAIAIGITGNGALLAWQVASGLDPWVVLTSALVWSAPFDVLMSVGYAAAIVDWARRHPDAWLTRRIAAAGRAALSNYLGTTLVMTSIFYGYGLGLFGHVPRAVLPLFVIGGWAAMLAWSAPWLSRCRYGPVEWAWRSAARAAWQPMRR